MCYYSVGYNYYDIKLTMWWRAEQRKRQRIFAFSQKTGFWVVGMKSHCNRKYNLNGYYKYLFTNNYKYAITVFFLHLIDN